MYFSSAQARSLAVVRVAERVDLATTIGGDETRRASHEFDVRRPGVRDAPRSRRRRDRQPYANPVAELSRGGRGLESRRSRFTRIAHRCGIDGYGLSVG